MQPTWESDCGTVKLWRGDCLEILPTWPAGAVDAVVTDPPYHEKTHSGARTTASGRAVKLIHYQPIDAPPFAEWCRVSRGWAVATIDWRHMLSAEDAGVLVRAGVWVKPDSAPQFTGDRPGTGWEAVAICHRDGRKSWNGGGRHAVWTLNQNRGSVIGGQKPVELVESFVSLFSNDEETIADPFMGSGTTGVAAVRLGRKFWGIELDEQYFEIAKRRIQDELKKVAFLEPKTAERQQLLIGGDQ